MIQKNQTQKRSKGRYTDTFKMKDVYKQYLKDNPKDSDFYVDYKTFISNIDLCFEKVLHNILYEADEITFPHRLGSISIIKTKMRMDKLTIDFAKSKELNTTIYHLNDHSNGYRMRYRWRKHKAIFTNRKYFSFIPSRQNKRLLSKLIQEGKTDYMSI